MVTDNATLARYLGRTAPEDFESEDEILAYFQPDGLRAMFGEEIDADDVARACELTLSRHREGK